MPSMAAHWKGVWGLGTKLLTEQMTRGRRRSSRTDSPASRQRVLVSMMPRRSSSVSVGRPIMK